MTETQAQDGQQAATSESSTNTDALATPPAAQNDNPFLSVVNQEYADLVAAKGWKSPDDVIASYTNMEKFAGKFSARGVVIPDGDSPDEWGKVYDKLGRPEAPNGYEFNHVDVSKADPELKDNLRVIAELGHKHGFSKKQFEGFVKEYDEVFGAKAEAETLEAQRQVNAKIENLYKEWGAAKDQNIALARAAAKKFGIEGEKLNALEHYVGFEPMMRVLADIGATLQEDGFVAGQSSSGSAAMTPKQAKAALQELQSDPDYLDAKKNPNRHKMLREKAKALYEQVYPTSQE